MTEQPFRLSYPRLALGVLGSAVVLFAALAGLWLDPPARAWTLVAGFTLLTASCVNTSRRFVMPAILGVILVVFCGFSAVVAVPEPIEKSIERVQTLDADDVAAVTPAEGFVNSGTEKGFKYAAMVTGLGGLAAMLAALLTAALLRAPAERIPRRPARIERAGKILVLIGFLGVAGALLRFGLTQFPVENLWESFKSFWIGGTYLLVIATFAVPGFALWVQGMVGRKAELREYLTPAIGSVLFVGLLIPTGQRGFLIALGVMLLAILLSNKVIGLRLMALLVALGIIFIGLTQAVRNEASGTNEITLDGFIERVQPDQWKDLYSSQIASFNWTVLVEENRDKLDIDNSFVDLLAKPIPRSIYPDKSQGFGDEFTSRVFPGAAAQDVSFATPLVSESDYNFGPLGAVVVLALLGAFCVVADRRIAQRAPPLVEPVIAATIFWLVFELIRGDVANALVFSAGWIIPLVIFSRAIGLRADPPIKRVVIDALQVAPKFSGIGRRVAEIGEGLTAEPIGVPVEVRCARDVADQMRAAFPEGTRIRTPLASSRPRIRRILYQQLIAPFLTGASTVVVYPGDQAPLWGRSPLLFVIHDVRRLAAPETAGAGAEKLYYGQVMKSGARRASHILTISEFSRAELEARLRPGCPVSIVSERPRDIEPVPPEVIAANQPGFVLVGALRGYKGIESVIEAVANGEDGAGRARIECVGDSEGDPEYARELETTAEESGIGDRFRMTGWISDAELRDLYGRSAGSINPSSYEGYGLSVSESIAAGLPTIASDIPPHREIGGDAALYFPPGDAAALSKLIAEIVNDPGRRAELAEAARRRNAELAESDQPWAPAIAESLRSIAVSG
ncbi:MAG TPA: glycosyltransferase [Solirubrobacterales bacterium]|nr:glycosyltransferase [Solirubrobacterales bacterium]